MKQTNCILFCRCGAKVIADARADDLSNRLKKLDADVMELSDLCAFSVHSPQSLLDITAGYTQKVIVACYPRAVKNMLRQGGATLENVTVVNFRAFDNDEVVSTLQSDYGFEAGAANYRIEKTGLDVPAWYPVIDESRCTSCGQCARFCLFGVYKFERKKLEVTNPLNCKNNCPACGRTCPTQAIIFPRLGENSVLSGAEPVEKAQQNHGKQGSLFVLLNERNKSRLSIFREGVVQLAEDERRKALEELKNVNKKKE
ncbi:4Fe-4S binding protein [Mangrovibacterium lignilyticum]|uniref:4Fe-4S binding protein n=1 Tax=Mangrovibacterium lignilyticum TaxID=2668052 RepID=UPI0013D395FD|nr:4Fe-4S binding protein [Mangrovibacterium lignilyticum]